MFSSSVLFYLVFSILTTFILMSSFTQSIYLFFVNEYCLRPQKALLTVPGVEAMARRTMMGPQPTTACCTRRARRRGTPRRVTPQPPVMLGRLPDMVHISFLSTNFSTNVPIYFRCANYVIVPIYLPIVV
jgi:hypothetical protein